MPLALATAVNPLMATVTIILLSAKKHPKGRTLAYLAGTMVTVAVIGFIFLNGADLISNRPKHPSTLSSLIDLGLGTLLVIFGIDRLFRKPKPKETKKTSASNENAGTTLQLIEAAGIGIALTATNFKALVFYLTAARETAKAHLPLADQIAAMALVGLGFIGPIALPLLAETVMPARSKHFLDVLNNLLTR